MSASLPTTDGGYACILADPPWSFLTYAGGKHDVGVTPHRCAEDHYATMNLNDLCALRVADVAAPNACLFMWVVGSHIPDAIALAAPWGFSYKTDAFYWFKQKLIAADQIDLFTSDIAAPRMGMGYWTRKQVETCLLFTRGKPKRLSKGVRQAIIAPIREHSRKPDEQYERIEALCSGPRLELFARRRRVGWDAWGNDVEKFGEAA